MNMTRMGRPPVSADGGPRTTRWPLTLSLGEIARLDALPGSSNPAKIMGAIDRIDALNAICDATEAERITLRKSLRDMVTAFDNAPFVSPDMRDAVDAARAVLGEEEEAR